MATRIGYVSVERHKMGLKRSFEVARKSNITSDWVMSATHIDADLNRDLDALRARARDLVLNNPYAASFVKMVRRNVIGSNGLKLQMKVRDPNGKADSEANRLIEEAWEDWGKKKNCTVTRMKSWLDVSYVATSHLISDGEFIFRKYSGFKNKHSFALQEIDPGLLDTTLNVQRDGRHNEIRMGVEMDIYGAPIAYWFKQYNGSFQVSLYQNYYSGERIRIPAEEIIHGFPMYFAGQTRGWPLMVPSMMALKMLGGYNQAVVVGARAGACQIAAIQTETTDGGFSGSDGKTEEGAPMVEMEPGMMMRLGPGETLKEFNPTQPTALYDPFEKAVLRSISIGTGYTYVQFTGDLSGVNYSSMRAGALEDREEHKYLQSLMITHFAEPVFEGWLPPALATGVIPLPLTKIDKFSKCKFTGRRWDWVDPQKEAEGAKIRIEQGLDTVTNILAEQGKDIEDVLRERQEELAMAEKYGVKLPEPGDQSSKASSPKAEFTSGQGGGADEDQN
jgi:lambda family phage portal protein